MARIEYIRLRLNNWALWKVREQSGGLGYATQSAMLVEPREDRYRQSIVPIDDVDASVTDQAVESLKDDKPEQYFTLQCVYPLGLGVTGAAAHQRKAVSTIHAQLDRADLALMAWFNTRRDQRRALRPVGSG